MGSRSASVINAETSIPTKNRYLAELDAAWKEYLKPRLPDALKTISLFAGCGGSSLGYSMAGFKELLACEWDDDAAETFMLNFPDIPMYHGDISKLSVDDCLKMTNLQVGELDVLDGSPPCQGFSLAGEREFSDQRNQLSLEFIRLLSGLKPRAFIMENVSGLVKGKMKLVFAEIMRELKVAGYSVKCQLMNMAYFGVPQNRCRMIFIGVRSDLGIIPTFPIPKVRPISVKEAIGHLPVGLPGEHSKQGIEAWYGAEGNKSLRKVNRFVGSFQSVRLDPDLPSPTQIKAHFNWHWLVPRQLTVQEAAILQSFPESFQFPCKKTAAKSQIGNSVPPLFMRAIANHVKGFLNG